MANQNIASEDQYGEYQNTDQKALMWPWAQRLW
jgi:hypothetical protein